MKVDYWPKSIRTLVPITVRIEEVTKSPLVWVKNQHEDSLVEDFQIQVKKMGAFYQGEFWFQQAGDYQLNVEMGSESYQAPFHVSKQEFLSFTTEFGFFSILLTLALGGIFIWYKRRQKFKRMSK